MIRTPSGCSTTISPFSTYWTRRVCARNAGTAEATNCSPSPRPTISGHSGGRRPACPARRGSSPRTRSGPRAARRPRGPRRRGRPRSSSAIRWAITSASVSEVNVLPCCQQALLQRHVVLDDPVDDHVDAVVAVVVGMGVGLAHTAVRGPAGVADAGRCRALGERDRAATGGRCRPSSFACSALRLPTARTASMRSSAMTEIPAES